MNYTEFFVDEMMRRLPPAIAAHARLGGECEICFVHCAEPYWDVIYVREAGRKWCLIGKYKRGIIPVVFINGSSALDWKKHSISTLQLPVVLPP